MESEMIYIGLDVHKATIAVEAMRDLVIRNRQVERMAQAKYGDLDALEQSGRQK